MKLHLELRKKTHLFVSPYINVKSAKNRSDFCNQSVLLKIVLPSCAFVLVANICLMTG